MKIELLDTQKHSREQFDCGTDALNLYLRHFANQDQRRNLTRIYVLAENTHIIGYYSISAHSVLTNELPDNKKLAHSPYAPFLLLRHLAIDSKFKHQGHGGELLFHALKTTAELAERIGILGMVVDAKDETTANFYAKFGFKRLLTSSNRLVLPLSAIKPLLD